MTDLRHSAQTAIGSASGTKYGYAKDGKPFLAKEPKLQLSDNNVGKPEDIDIIVGRPPHAAVGNPPVTERCSNTPRLVTGRNLAMIVLHHERNASTPTVPR
jgi:hypothetical protein